MKTLELPVEPLLDFGQQLFRHHGVPKQHARTVTSELGDSDLWGQGGHGCQRIPDYLLELAKGDIKPWGKLRVEIDGGPFVRVASNNFGQVSGNQGIDLACSRAEKHDVCMMAWRRFHHIGRAGSWVWKAAERGLGAIIFVNTWGAPRVRTAGGITPVFGTCPAAFALPGEEHPELIDFSGATMVEGKVKKRKNNGEPIPPGCIADGYGNPSTDGRVIYRKRRRGSIRALGGDAAEWKGAAFLSAMDLFAGLLSGTGFADGSNVQGDAKRISRNGALLILFRVEKFRRRSELNTDIARYVEHVKSSVPASSGVDVLFAGEKGRTHREVCLERGLVPLDMAACKTLRRSGEQAGIQWIAG